ncbi:MAG: AI-2E family transporter [Candidatus Pacearchaeota archaeon]|nr:AI-2E family transporter [Candidatus Pacearchaeota archaeon]
MAKINQYQKVVPFIIFILALFLLFKLVQPVITIILSSILLAYISFPLYKRIIKKIQNESISIVLSLLIIVIIILVPFTFLALGIAQQGFHFYNSLSNNIEKGALFGYSCTGADSKVCLILNQAEKFSLEQLSKFGFDKQIQKFLPILEEKITIFILSIPLIIAGIFITLVITFFILKDWENILKKIVDLLPMRTKTIKRFIKEFRDITHTVIFAQLFVALIQGIVGIIGFYLLGVPFPLILGVILAFFALIPAIGTAIIWFPASLYLILMGYFSQDYWILSKGIILFFYGLFVISTIDNLLLAKIVHSKAKINQITTIVGVIGGASLFGVVGIFIGPILLPLLITYFYTFKERFV